MVSLIFVTQCLLIIFTCANQHLEIYRFHAVLRLLHFRKLCNLVYCLPCVHFILIRHTHYTISTIALTILHTRGDHASMDLCVDVSSGVMI